MLMALIVLPRTDLIEQLSEFMTMNILDSWGVINFYIILLCTCLGNPVGPLEPLNLSSSL